MEYPKINTLFKRDLDHKIIETDFSDPIFDYLKNNEWIATEKVDGTNIRIMWDGFSLSFGGRTNAASIPASIVKVLQDIFFPRKNWFEEKFKSYPICFYGEGYGAKIQKGGGNYKADGVDFVLFDIFCGSWMERENVEDIGHQLGIRVVPVTAIGTLAQLIRNVRDGIESQWGNFQAEGVVARPKIELLNRRGRRVITKLKTKDFMKNTMIK